MPRKPPAPRSTRPATRPAPPDRNRDRDRWLRALSATADSPHHSRSLLLYRLLKLSNLIETPFFNGDSVRYQISMNELRVLMTLAPLGEAASHEIGEVAGVHPMNVSRAVAALRRSGRLTERSDPQNRRRKLLTLTADGKKLYRTLMPHVQEVAGKLFDGMTPEEITTLSRLLAGMTERIQSTPAATSAAADSAAE